MWEFRCIQRERGILPRAVGLARGLSIVGFVRRAHSRTCIRLGVRMLLGTCKTANVHVSIENTHEIVALLCYGLLFHAFSASRLPQQQHLLPHQPTRLSRLGPNWSESNRVFGFRVAGFRPYGLVWGQAMRSAMEVLFSKRRI